MRRPTESDLPLHGWRPYSDFHRERIRASEKHAGGGDMERADWRDERWLPVVVEEVGEVARVLNDGGDERQLREELVQVGAMVAAWVDAIEEHIFEHALAAMERERLAAMERER